MSSPPQKPLSPVESEALFSMYAYGIADVLAQAAAAVGADIAGNTQRIRAIAAGYVPVDSNPELLQRLGNEIATADGSDAAIRTDMPRTHPPRHFSW